MPVAFLEKIVCTLDYRRDKPAGSLDQLATASHLPRPTGSLGRRLKLRLVLDDEIYARIVPKILTFANEMPQ